MDCRIVKIKEEYFDLIDELKDNIEKGNDICICLDKIELFWIRKRSFLINYVRTSKFSYIGGAMYIYFFENEHFLPLAINSFLIMDEPICKSTNMLRVEDVINKDRINEVIKNIVNILEENRERIINSNIIVIPLRTYFKNIDDIHELATHFTNQFISESCNCVVNKIDDLDEVAKQLQNDDDFNSKINTEYFFTELDDMNKSSKDKIMVQCKNSGMKNFKDDYQSLLHAYYISIYGLFCQAFDLIYMSYYFEYDLFVFRDSAMYYLNVIESNLDENYPNEKKLVRNAHISYFLHKMLLSNNIYENKRFTKSRLKKIYENLTNDPNIYKDNHLDVTYLNECISKVIKK